ncbi:MAG: S4 domain-containing protein, partial [Rhodoferax sp.]
MQAHEDAAETGPEVELRALTIGAAQHGERLDRALVALVPEFSRSYLQQLIEAGAVSINGAVSRKPS